MTYFICYLIWVALLEGTIRGYEYEEWKYDN